MSQYKEKILKAKAAVQSRTLNGLVPRGTWNEKNIYTPQDIVYYKGKTYICITSNQGSIPNKSKDFVPFAGNGKDGLNAKNIEVGRDNTHIRWRYIDSTKWYNIIEVEKLIGPQGTQGETGEKGDRGEKGIVGENGKQVQLRTTKDAIEWRYEGGTWIVLIRLNELKGPKGDKGDDGKSAYEIWLEIGNTGTKRDFLEALKSRQPVILGRGGGGGGTSAGVQTIVAGTGITVNSSDPRNPIVSASGGAGTGDVVGPASSTDNDFVQFNGATGKLIKDGGLSLDTDGTLAANSDTKIPSQKAVKTYVDALNLGIRRIVTVTSGGYTAGSTAFRDYVYLVAGLHAGVLPTASGNSNRYTFKNNHSADITITRAGSDTIEGATSITIAPEDSVDLISNGSNAWSVI